MKREINIRIDLNSKDFEEILLKQLDTTRLIFEIYKDNERINLDGLTSNIIFTKPNGKVVIQEAEINEKTVIVDLLTNCVRVYGKGLIEVELKKDEEVISSFQMICRIEKTGKNLEPDPDEPSYYEKNEQILEEIQTKLEHGDFNGLTAYEVAVKNGFEGTEAEWLESLKPVKGTDYYTEQDKEEIEEDLIESLNCLQIDIEEEVEIDEENEEEQSNE